MFREALKLPNAPVKLDLKCAGFSLPPAVLAIIKDFFLQWSAELCNYYLFTVQGAAKKCSPLKFFCRFLSNWSEF